MPDRRMHLSLEDMDDLRAGHTINVPDDAGYELIVSCDQKTWPTNDEEEQRFTDWQSAVADRDTHLGFRQWLANEAD